MANALRAVCIQSWYSSPLAVSPLGVSFTPLLERGVPKCPFRGVSGLGVMRRDLTEDLPLFEKLFVLLWRHELHQFREV